MFDSGKKGYFTGGKADFVKWGKSDGTIEDICLLEHNIDFRQGCINKPICEVCYAKDISNRLAILYKKYENLLNDTIKHTYKNQFVAEIAKKKVNIVRFGKNTECGHPEDRKILLKTLDILAENDASCIFITKDLEFDKNVADYFMTKGSVLFYSIGNDGLEKGACKQGFTNDFRMYNAQKYLDYGVNARLKVLSDFSVSPEEAAKRGWYIKKLIEEFPEWLKRSELMPLRMQENNVTLKATGETRDILTAPYKNQKFLAINWLEGRTEPKYVKEKRNQRRIILNKFHDAYQEWVDDLRICGHFGTYEKGFVCCDKCFVNDERRIYPLSQNIEVKYRGRREKNRKKIYAERKDKKYQIKMEKILEVRHHQRTMDEILKQSEGEKQQGILKI